MKNSKRVAIGARPPTDPHADAWVRQGDGAHIGKTDLYTARLTIDVTPTLRARIKVDAFTRGITVAEMLRGLLELEFPEKQP
ncbi:chromosome partitioning protein ParB [Undibacterium arcticum]|uniref:Chromosome partitioning protein ParB n=1 Tax=Undibacterium arcticum TaxID=1762892 RepID=A0ABV7F882_9BURK